MLIEQTLDNLRHLKLFGMVQALEEQRSNALTQGLSFEERLGMCVDVEMQSRENRRLTQSLKVAKLKESASPEDINFRASRGLDRQVIATLLTCDWIDKSLNTIITGPTGVGKTWIACALGQQAARKGYSVLYKRFPRLLEELVIAYADGSLAKQRAKIAKTNLLILDDFGLAPIVERGRQELLEVVDDHLGHGSLIITSQLPIDRWHDYLGEPTVADAILDRIVHRAHRIELRGESMRKAKKTE